jgi:hypothetical protein
MLGMTVAFGVAGVAQVYIERKLKMEFMDVQKEIEIHFVVLLICAIADVLTYVYASWGNSKKKVTPAMVKAQRK